MSADSWQDCPRCKSRSVKQRAEQLAKAEAAYGKVPPDEYMGMLNEAQSPPDFEEETFREDFEQGLTRDGYYIVSYSGQCRVCNLSHRFSHKEPVFLEGTDR